MAFPVWQPDSPGVSEVREKQTDRHSEGSFSTFMTSSLKSQINF